MYENQTDIRGEGEVIGLTQDQIKEYIKCSEDPIYFIKNYIYIVSGWKGKPQKVLFIPEPYQEKLIMALHNERFVIGKLSRQVGKSTALDAYAVWCSIFEDNFSILLAANKEKSATNNMKAFQNMYRSVPLWLQVGVKRWRATSIEFENNSSFSIETTTESSGRSGAYSLVILDEFAFVDREIADPFYAAIYPTISSNIKSKLAIISTPNGMNHFHNLWKKAVNKQNEFIPVEIKWNDPPNRDEKFKQTTIENTSMETWLQEYECIFAGSKTSLIKADILSNLELSNDFETVDKDLYIFEKPKKNNEYFITVDVARGREKDNSALIVFDITQIPYKVVATYANNEISPLAYPNIIQKIAEKYNEASVLIELNDGGQEVADLLFNINEYDNVMHITKEDGKQVLSGGDGDLPGVTTSGATKSLGCTTLRAIIENGQLIVNDFRLQEELSNFTQQGTTYKASTGNKDDLVMCLVIFAWATNQEYFKDISGTDVRSKLFDKYKETEDEKMLPVVSDDFYDPRYERLREEAVESAWLQDNQYHIILKDINTKTQFICGKTTINPKECDFIYMKFSNEKDALETGKKIAEKYKNYKFIGIIDTRNLQEWLSQLSNSFF